MMAEWETGGKSVAKKNMVQKTVDVLFFLSAHPEGAKLTDIAAALRFPKTTVFDILKTLAKNDFVQAGSIAKKEYTIGSQIYAIGFSYLESSKLFKIAQPYLSLLADKYQKTAFIAKRHNDRITHVYKYASPYAKAPTSNIGDQKMLHCTAIGKCYMAFDPEAAPLIDTIELVPATPYTIVSRTELRSQLDYFRTLGYAYERRESHEMMACLAAPVFNGTVMAGTISLTGFYREDEDFSGQGKEMAQLGLIISEQLGN
jgi:DNA-binding IclR family transcriptional regulator